MVITDIRYGLGLAVMAVVQELSGTIPIIVHFMNVMVIPITMATGMHMLTITIIKQKNIAEAQISIVMVLVAEVL